MPEYKLHYFHVKGLGEAIRLMLHYTGQPFEDIRIASEQWPELKAKFFYEKVPVLEVDGKQLAQSGAILRFLGEKHDLLGKDEWERAKVNEIFDFYKDVYAELAAYLYVKMGFREGNAAQLYKEVFLPGAERHFPRFVKLLAQSSSGFFAPSGLTFVDFALAEYFDNVRANEPDTFVKYPELIAHSAMVHSLPQLKEYMSSNGSEQPSDEPPKKKVK